MTQPNIEVDIEELVLHGFPPGDRHRIGEALERELGRLLAERGATSELASGGEVAGLDGGTFSVEQGARPEAIGAQIAHAVFRGLGR